MARILDGTAGVAADSDDVPSPIDLRDENDARVWVASAEQRRPWRARFRRAFVDLLGAEVPGPVRVLELGAGPGLLAEAILRGCEVAQYTLLDFSGPMLEMSRHRLAGWPGVSFVQGDFKLAGWTGAVGGPFDAIVTMQAVHELRHKRHFAGLYRQAHALLRSGGALLVCEHSPRPDVPKTAALNATIGEQHAALHSAGFERVRTALELEGMYLCLGFR